LTTIVNLARGLGTAPSHLLTIFDGALDGDLGPADQPEPRAE
jgi:hypothetical protein